MDEFRKQLDALMGANRNGDVLEVKRNYWDRDVCRLYLTGLCPRDLFQLTERRRDKKDRKDRKEREKDRKERRYDKYNDPEYLEKKRKRKEEREQRHRRERQESSDEDQRKEDRTDTLEEKPSAFVGKNLRVDSPPATSTDVDTGPKRRVMGPAMPSADMLAAAARLTEAEARLREAELELENDPLIGPAPATLVAEAASANDAERFEEVTRMLSREIRNAYDLLGVKSDVEPAVLKKKYWKLSLLVHPDKCDHPQAHEAFMALNKAFKDLQDPTKKAEIDRKVAEEKAREEFAAELQAKREAAQWRRLRGEEEEGDDELLRGPKEAARDEWMTKLPPERQAGGPPAQHNTFFSKSEKSGRGDTSAWTDTPADKAQKAKMQYLEAYKQAAITNGAPEELEEREKERAAKEALLVDSYNSHKRSQSLMEKYQAERSAGAKKQKKEKKAKKEGGAPEKEPEWRVNHPWKPWDRDKDLTAGRKSVNLDPKNFKESLKSRFGGFTDNEPRKFL